MHLPHDGVYARVGVSGIHGVGVFAIRAIPAGTDIFANDRAEIVWVDRSALDDATPAQRRLYHDFGIARGDRIGCPANFNLLTTGWHLNEPRAGEEANVLATADVALIAARDIAEGEELTVRYDTFSDQAP